MKVETYTSWLALPVAGCWVIARGCVCRLCGDLNTARRLSFSDEMRVRSVLYMKRAIQIDVFIFFRVQWGPYRKVPIQHVD